MNQSRSAGTAADLHDWIPATSGRYRRHVDQQAGYKPRQCWAAHSTSHLPLRHCTAVHTHPVECCVLLTLNLICEFLVSTFITSWIYTLSRCRSTIVVLDFRWSLPHGIRARKIAFWNLRQYRLMVDIIYYGRLWGFDIRAFAQAFQVSKVRRVISASV